MDFKQIVKGVSKLIKSVSNKERVYYLHFTKEDDNKWYIDLPDWPFDHHNLMMVAGADKLCKELSYDGRHTKVEVMIADSEKEELEMNRTHQHTDIMAVREDYSITGGANYKASACDYREITPKFWLCPVTLFVLGHYPKYLRIRGLK